MYSMQLLGGSTPFEVKVQPWPDTTIRPNIEWLEGDHWIPCDRGAAGDVYESRLTVFGQKSEMDALDLYLQKHARQAFQISGAGFMPFAPVIEQAGTMTVFITSLERKRREFWASPSNGVDEWTMTLQAVKPSLVATAASLSTLCLQPQYEHDHSRTVTSGVFGGGNAFAIDNRGDIGRFRGTFIQRTEEARAILKFLLASTRGNLMAFPSIGVEFPFGKSFAGSSYCRWTDLEVRRLSLSRWQIGVTFLEVP